VSRINLLKLAPGGHLGRLVLWTEGAFRKLDTVFGTWTRAAAAKKGFTLPRAKMTNSDFGRLIRSDEIAKVVRPVKKQVKKGPKMHRNPLKKPALMAKMNPYASVLRRAAVLASSKTEVAKKEQKKPGSKQGAKKVAATK